MGVENIENNAQQDGVEAQEVKNAPTEGDQREALKKEIASTRAGNDKMEQTIAKEEGKEGVEKKKGVERLRELISDRLQPFVQVAFGFNKYTDFSKRDTQELQRNYENVQRSLSYVNSHTTESLSDPRFREELQSMVLQPSLDQYRSEEPEGEIPENTEKLGYAVPLELFREALITSVKEVEAKIVEELQKRNIDPAAEREQRIQDGEQVDDVQSVPQDADLNQNSKNDMRKFRNQIYRAVTVDGLSYYQLFFTQEKNEIEKQATKTFNTLVERFDNALNDCVERGLRPDQKNARASLINEYSQILISRPIDAQTTFPTFKEWLRNRQSSNEGSQTKEKSSPQDATTSEAPSQTEAASTEP